MADPDTSQSMMQWLMSLFGIAAGGGALGKTVLNASAVEARLDHLEKQADAHAEAIRDGAAVVARIDGRMESMSGTLDSIRDLLMRGGK